MKMMRKKRTLFSSSSSKKTSDSKSKTCIRQFWKRLNKFAEDDKLDPIVGREKEIERVSQILSRRKRITPY